MPVNVIDKRVAFDEDADGLLIKHAQFIPGSFLDEIQTIKGESISTPAGEFHLAARIPTGVVDKWRGEGFDINKEPIRDILKRLRKEQLDGFIATNRRI